MRIISTQLLITVTALVFSFTIGFQFIQQRCNLIPRRQTFPPSKPFPTSSISPLHNTLIPHNSGNFIEQIAAITKSKAKNITPIAAASTASVIKIASTPKYLKLLTAFKNFIFRQVLNNPIYTFFYIYGFFYILSLVGTALKPVTRQVNRFRHRGNKINLQEIEELKKTSEFDIYECEVCQMELRPAKGRARYVFAKPAFRCAKCGAKATKFFNIYDMKDPRAKARWERIQKEKEQEDKDMFDDEEEREE